MASCIFVACDADFGVLTVNCWHAFLHFECGKFRSEYSVPLRLMWVWCCLSSNQNCLNVIHDLFRYWFALKSILTSTSGRVIIYIFTLHRWNYLHFYIQNAYVYLYDVHSAMWTRQRQQKHRSFLHRRNSNDHTTNIFMQRQFQIKEVQTLHNLV